MGNIEQQLRKIAKKDRECVFDAFDKMWKRKFGALDRKKLKGHDHIFRIRIGKYRIVYFDDGKMMILKGVLKRSEGTYRDV